MVSLTAGDLTNLRSKRHANTLYLSILIPHQIFSGTVDDVGIARGERSIDVLADASTTALTQAKYTGFFEGMTFEVDTTDGTKKVRVKNVTVNDITSVTFEVDENAIDWSDNDPVRLMFEYRVWPVPPRIDLSTGVFYKYYDTAYSNQNSQPPPVTIAGPHQAGFLSGGSLTLSVPVGDSYVIAQGAAISSRSVDTSLNAGPTGTAPTIGAFGSGKIDVTYTAAGVYWVLTSTTDDNGQSQDTFRAHFVYDENTQPYTDFTVTSVTGNWQSGGYRFTVNATGDVTLDDFPDGSIALLWYESKLDGTEGYVNLWEDASSNKIGNNIICCGYINHDSSQDDYQSGDGSVSFDIVTPQALLDEMTDFGAVSIEAVTDTPATWFQYEEWLTVGRGIHHELRWQSTAFQTMDIYGLTANTTGVQVIEFTEPSLYQRCNNFAFDRGIFARLTSDRLGRLHLVQDSQMLNDAGRTALDTVFSVTNADISTGVNIPRREHEQTAIVDLDGFSFDGSSKAAIIAMAPGYDDGGTSINMGEFRGTGNLAKSGQVLASQTDANEKSGRLLAMQNNPIEEIRLDFRGNYLGAFDIVPSIGFYTVGWSNTDLKRQLALNGTNMICRQVINAIDVQAGTIQTSAVFETEAIGADGIPGNYPLSYPASTTTGPDPSWSTGCSTLTAGTAGTFTTGAVVSMEFARFNDQYGVVLWREGSDGQIATVDCSVDPPTFGSILTVDGGLFGTICSVATIDETTAIIAWASGVGLAGKAAIISRSGTTLSMPGSAVTFNAGNTTDISIGVFSSSLACVAYVVDSTTDEGRVNTLTISGSTLTANTLQTFLSNNPPPYDVQLGIFSATQAVIMYADTSNSNNATFVGLSVSGTTITLGTVVDTGQAIRTTDGAQKSIAKLTSSLGVAVYTLSAGDINAVGFTLSGNIVALGTPVTIFPGNIATNISIARIADNRALIVEVRTAATITLNGSAIQDDGNDLAFETDTVQETGRKASAWTMRSPDRIAIGYVLDNAATNPDDGKVVVLSCG